MKDKILYAKAKLLYFLNKGRNPICDAAFEGLTSKHTPKRAGMCQMNARIDVESVLHHAMLDPNAASAREASMRFDGTIWSHEPEEGSLPGDLLYKEHGSGGFGHVGIRFWGNMVIENSSADIDENGDARGIRTLAAFGSVDRIVRFYDMIRKEVIK